MIILEDRALLSAYVVNTLEDATEQYSVVGEFGTITYTALRAAIDLGNNDQDSTIDISFGVSGTIYLEHGALPTLEGNTFTIDGADAITIDAQAESGIFCIYEDAIVNIYDIILTNAANDPAIANDGDLTLSGGTISNCEESAIQNTRNQDITDQTFDGNQSTTPGGAIRNLGTSTITNCILSNNQANQGGAIANVGQSATLTISESSLYLNTGTNAGGAIVNGANATLILGSNNEIYCNTSFDGGAIYNSPSGQCFVGGSTWIYSNTATHYGGGIYNAGQLSLSCLYLCDNYATKEGGGLYNSAIAELADVELTNNRVTDQTEGFGGAISSTGLATTTLTSGCIFTGNVCDTAGNGNAIYVYANGNLYENASQNTFGQNQTIVRE